MGEEWITIWISARNQGAVRRKIHFIARFHHCKVPSERISDQVRSQAIEDFDPSSRRRVTGIGYRRMRESSPKGGAQHLAESNTQHLPGQR